ncbi:MAG: AbgT family transporter [Synergistaceae bacterium]|jgi:hypothetical protein|nr:AbgT family transporter [Synergistaceae bacterium]
MSSDLRAKRGGLCVVAVLGTGVADKSGFLAVMMRRMLVGVPPFLVTLILVFVCINGNVAGDPAAGYSSAKLQNGENCPPRKNFISRPLTLLTTGS